MSNCFDSQANWMSSGAGEESETDNALLQAQERPATPILTVTSGLRFTRARHVNKERTESGSWKFCSSTKNDRNAKNVSITTVCRNTGREKSVRGMCQSLKFVTWDRGFCHMKRLFRCCSCVVRRCSRSYKRCFAFEKVCCELWYRRCLRSCHDLLIYCSENKVS